MNPENGCAYPPVGRWSHHSGMAAEPAKRISNRFPDIVAKWKLTRQGYPESDTQRTPAMRTENWQALPELPPSVLRFNDDVYRFRKKASTMETISKRISCCYD